MAGMLCNRVSIHVKQLHAARLSAIASTRFLRKGTVIRASNYDDAADRLAEVDAMKEAMEVYKQAQEMAQQQVMQELMQMELSDMQVYNDTASLNTQDPQSLAQAARNQSSKVYDERPIQSFWIEQGLKESTASYIARDMVAQGTPYCDITLLQTQMQRLSRVIPGPVQDIVSRDWRILETSPGLVAQHYVELVQLFPEDMDISELAARQPKLLYCDNLVPQFQAVVDKLAQIHPSHSKDEAIALLADNPELLFRLPFYLHVRTLDELPIDIQNSLVYTGQGLQQLHQMYSDSVSPRFL